MRRRRRYRNCFCDLQRVPSRLDKVRKVHQTWINTTTSRGCVCCVCVYGLDISNGRRMVEWQMKATARTETQKENINNLHFAVQFIFNDRVKEVSNNNQTIAAAASSISKCHANDRWRMKKSPNKPNATKTRQRRNFANAWSFSLFTHANIRIYNIYDCCLSCPSFHSISLRSHIAICVAVFSAVCLVCCWFPFVPIHSDVRKRTHARARLNSALYFGHRIVCVWSQNRPTTEDFFGVWSVNRQ